MPFLTSPDNVRLKYELVGDGPDLLLHLGTGCDSGLWHAAGYLEPLSKSYRCILFDHRGHGESDHPSGVEAYLIDRLADDVVALLDHLEIKSFAFWGYSAGIDVGLKVADDSPERLWALLGSGGVAYTPPAEFAELVARRLPEYREHGWEKVLARFDEQEQEPIPLWMKERIRATDIQFQIDRLQAATLETWDDWEALARVKTPTLFLTGELEDPEDKTAEAAARMRNGTRVRLPGLGHINAFLAGDLVMPKVEEFLARYAP